MNAPRFYYHGTIGLALGLQAAMASQCLVAAVLSMGYHNLTSVGGLPQLDPFPCSISGEGIPPGRDDVLT